MPGGSLDSIVEATGAEPLLHPEQFQPLETLHYEKRHTDTPEGRVPLRQPPPWLSSLCDTVGTLCHVDTHSQHHGRTWAWRDLSPSAPCPEQGHTHPDSCLCPQSDSKGGLPSHCSLNLNTGSPACPLGEFLVVVPGAGGSRERGWM